MKNETRRPLVAAVLRQTRKAFVSVAALSAVTNILMLTGPLFMMQVYDRVLASRSVPTLVALSGLAISLYVFLGVLELIRSVDGRRFLGGSAPPLKPKRSQRLSFNFHWMTCAYAVEKNFH